MTLLDGFDLTWDGRVVPVPRALQRVVAFLGLRGSRSRAYLAGMLWPETTEERAFGSLRTALWRLQRYAPVVFAAGETLQLDRSVRVDVDELEKAARLVLTGQDPTSPAGLVTARAGELLPGWYEDWVVLDRERLRQLRLHTLEELARGFLVARGYTQALDAALTAMGDEPLRETPSRLAMEIHVAEGNACEALRVYESYRALLWRELGITPSPAMRRLVGQVLHVARTDRASPRDGSITFESRA